MATTEPQEEVAAPIETNEVGPEETEQQIKERAMRQIEFYLSDSNLPFDQFLWNIYDKTIAHWVPIKQMASFKRMRQFEPYGDKWLVDVLRESKVLEVDEKGENVRRTASLVERPRESVESRSVYAKNFPEEYESLQPELERYFSRFGVINAVRMRRKEDKAFKGSVFCEFSEVESAQRFLDGTKREFKGVELVVMSKADYIKMKCEEKGILPDAPRTTAVGGTGGGGGKRKFNAFALMKRQGRTDADPRPEPVDLVKTFSILGQDLKIVQEDGTWRLQDESSLTYVPGATIGFEAGEGDLKMGAIKAAVKSILDIPSYIINKQGERTGYVVCQRAILDEEFTKLVNAGDIVDGAAYTWRKLSEDEEKPLQLDYIRQSIVRMGGSSGSDGRSNTRGGKSGRGRGGRHGGGRGGRGGGRGGGRDNNRNRDRDASKGEVKAPAQKESGDTVKEKAERMKIDPLAGAKRKRDTEPDGPEKGDRGAGPAVIKKAKVD